MELTILVRIHGYLTEKGGVDTKKKRKRDDEEEIRDKRKSRTTVLGEMTRGKRAKLHSLKGADHRAGGKQDPIL